MIVPLTPVRSSWAHTAWAALLTVLAATGAHAQTLEELKVLQTKAAIEVKRLEAAILDIEATLHDDERRIEERLRTEPMRDEVAEELAEIRRRITVITLGGDPSQAMLAAQERFREIYATHQSPQSAGADCGPLMRQDIPELERRALSLPRAQVHAFPGTGAKDHTLPVFTVLHVFDEAPASDDTLWIKVGANSACNSIMGWIAKDAAEDWRTMLVMQFAPRGSRERVLFFDRGDDLAGLVESGFAAKEADDAYDRIADGTADADIYVAIEPKTAASFSERPFLMPILDWRYTSFLDGDPVTLLEIAGLNADPEATPQATIGDADRGDLGRVQPALRNFKIGVKFVIDTTISMRPYLERTQDIVGEIYGRLGAEGLLSKAAFGLVAYRDNITPNARIEYVTRVIQRLDSHGDPLEILDNIRRAKPSPVPTEDWDEDAYAGLAAAIDDNDWDEFDLRLVILISDAGARERFDPLASITGLGGEEVRERARFQNIVVVPIHLLTDQARREGNVAPARRQYEQLSRTGDINDAKYIGIEAGDPDAFRADVSEFADDLVRRIAQIARGRVVEPGPVELRPNQRFPRLKDVFANELFRAQLEFLGAARDGQQRFYRAWAADRDLTDPSKIALEVKAFFTRNQLNDLAQGLQRIIDAADRNGASPQEFFNALATLSASMAVEGARENADEIEIGALLPAFLRALPYRSRILRMRLEDWVSLGATGRDELINELRSKQISYADLNAAETKWVDFTGASGAGGDPARMVAPVPLSLLP